MSNGIALREPLTPADIAARRGINPVHVDFSRSHSAWIYEVEGVPGLHMTDANNRGQTTRTWSVDGKTCRSIEAALAVVNGEISIEEAMVQISPPAQRPKKSLIAQIAEVDYELKQREDVYKRIISGHPHRKSELELHVENLQAVRATLVWLQDNELLIKQRASY